MNLRSALLAAASATMLLSACAKPSGQNQYQESEVGKSTLIEFGTVITQRQVDVTGKNSGTGGLLGAGVGAGAGSYAGGGSGSIWTTLGGAVIGGVAGSVAEQGLRNGHAIEYVITTEKGKTLSVTQNMNEGDVTLQPGQRVMVQTSGSYQRVLPADSMPTEIKRPKGIKVVD